MVIQILWLVCLLVGLQTALAIQEHHHKHHHKHHHHHEDASSPASSTENADAHPSVLSPGPDAVNLLETFAHTQAESHASAKLTVNARTGVGADAVVLSNGRFATSSVQTMRLIGGENPSSGRVEVFHDGQWGTICDDGFDKADGDVVCRQLGLGEATSVSCCGAYGQGTGQIWLADLQCAGSEVRVDECKGKAWGATGTCKHNEDAGVACSAVDCVVSEYDSPTPCSATCGGGTTRRVRRIVTLPTPEGRACPKQMEIVAACNTQACPEDCETSVWADWSPCSFTCGGGTQMRKRDVSKQALNGGKHCPTLAESRLCNTHNCPTDCVPGPWSDWSGCSQTCGVGERARSRAVISPNTDGGRDCGMLSMSQACNTAPCPEDCTVREWSGWSECDKPCNNGTRSRTRDLASPPNFGGLECPPLRDSEFCNIDPCPIDCIVTAWSAWGQCDRLCGNGVQYRTRAVERAPQFAGAPCGPVEDSQACNVNPCKMDYVRNLIDRVRRLELQNRVAKLEQLQTKLAAMAARERAQQILEQAKNMRDAAAPLYIPVSTVPIVDQSSASQQGPPTADPFPQPLPKSSSSAAAPVPLGSSSSSSSGAAAPAQLVSVHEDLYAHAAQRHPGAHDARAGPGVAASHHGPASPPQQHHSRASFAQSVDNILHKYEGRSGAGAGGGGHALWRHDDEEAQEHNPSPFPSPLLIETHETWAPQRQQQQQARRSSSQTKLSDLKAELTAHAQAAKVNPARTHAHEQDDVAETALTLLQVASDEHVLHHPGRTAQETLQSRRDALLAMTDILSTAVNDALTSLQDKSQNKNRLAAETPKIRVA